MRSLFICSRTCFLGLAPYDCRSRRSLRLLRQTSVGVFSDVAPRVCYALDQGKRAVGHHFRPGTSLAKMVGRGGFEPPEGGKPGCFTGSSIWPLWYLPNFSRTLWPSEELIQAIVHRCTSREPIPMAFSGRLYWQ